MATHPRAQAFEDAYEMDTTIVDVIQTEVGEHRRVLINFADKTWSFDFCHTADHDFVDVNLFDDAKGVEQFHRNTSDAKNNPDGPSTPIGVFGMIQGRQLRFPPAEDLPTNHGWTAAVLVTLLADNP